MLSGGMKPESDSLAPRKLVPVVWGVEVVTGASFPATGEYGL
jgi:hypothetical protein